MNADTKQKNEKDNDLIDLSFKDEPVSLKIPKKKSKKVDGYSDNYGGILVFILFVAIGVYFTQEQTLLQKTNFAEIKQLIQENYEFNQNLKSQIIYLSQNNGDIKKKLVMTPEINMEKFRFIIKEELEQLNKDHTFQFSSIRFIAASTFFLVMVVILTCYHMIYTLTKMVKDQWSHIQETNEKNDVKDIDDHIQDHLEKISEENNNDIEQSQEQEEMSDEDEEEENAVFPEKEGFKVVIQDDINVDIRFDPQYVYNSCKHMDDIKFVIFERQTSHHGGFCKIFYCNACTYIIGVQNFIYESYQNPKILPKDLYYSVNENIQNVLSLKTLPHYKQNEDTVCTHPHMIQVLHNKQNTLISTICAYCKMLVEKKDKTHIQCKITTIQCDKDYCKICATANSLAPEVHFHSANNPPEIINNCKYCQWIIKENTAKTNA